MAKCYLCGEWGPYSSYRHFTTVVDRPEPPVLESPSDGATNVSINPRLYWSPGGGGEPDSYDVEVYDPFGTCVYSDASSNESEGVGPLSYNITYSWRVRAKNAGGRGRWSDWFSFTTEGVSSEGVWEVQTSNTATRLYSVDAVSDRVVWVAGQDGVILRTTDGGENWEDVAGDNDTLSFASIAGLDANTAVVAGWWNLFGGGYDTYILRTVDGGNHWTRVYAQAGGFLDNITMFNQTDGVAFGDPVDGTWTLLETTDGGQTWSPQTGAPSQIDDEYSYFNGIQWVDNSEAWFGTHYPRAYHTTDGGASWTDVSFPVLIRVYTIAFNPSGTGLASQGTDGVLVRTTDGGESWDEIASPGSGMIRFITFSNGRFWLLMDGSLYSSSDDGDTWDEETSVAADLRHLSFAQAGSGLYGWSVGDQGVILRYAPETGVVNFERTDVTPSRCQLYQNYPNPFNPSTTIRFHLQKPVFVTLKVYDLMSKEIETLVEEPRGVGEYEVRWDTEGLPSGIYLYRLEAGDYVETRKLILQK